MMRRALVALLLTVLALVGLAVPARTLPAPYPNYWPQNTTHTIVYGPIAPNEPGGGAICTVQFQYGQFGGAAYVKFHVVPDYSNRPGCFIGGQLCYDRGTGTHCLDATVWTADTATLPGGWYQFTVNPAYFITASFNIGVWDATGTHQTGWQTWGSYACPSGC